MFTLLWNTNIGGAKQTMLGYENDPEKIVMRCMKLLAEAFGAKTKSYSDACKFLRSITDSVDIDVNQTYQKTIWPYLVTIKKDSLYITHVIAKKEEDYYLHIISPSEYFVGNWIEIE